MNIIIRLTAGTKQCPQHLFFEATSQNAGFDVRPLSQADALLQGASARILDTRPYAKHDLQQLSAEQLLPFMHVFLSERHLAEPALDASSCIQSLLSPDTYWVTLGQQYDCWKAPMLAKAISQKSDGTDAIRAYQAKWNLGASTWVGGNIFKNGQLVARYSYNGRLWPILEHGWQPGTQELSALP